MSPKRVYFIMLGLVVLLGIGTLVGAYGINLTLEKQSAKLVDLKAQNTAVAQQQKELSKARSDITTYTGLYNIARTVVPQNKDQAETVREIVNLAALNHITLGSFAFPVSNLGSGGTVSTKTTTTAPAAVTAGNPALSQLVLVPNIPGVYVLSIAVSGATGDTHLVSYPELISFLASLEQNRQTALISSITITPSPTAGPGLFSFALNLNIYIKP